MNERRSAALPERTDVRDAILRSALNAFSTSGFHGASMRDVARDADVSIGNVYNYFPAKSDILLGILKRASLTQMTITQEAVDSAGEDVVSRFAAAVDAFVRFYAEHLDECFVANSELRYLNGGQREEIVALRDEEQELFEELIAEGVEQGAFRTPYPAQAAIAILTMCAGVTVWYRTEGPLTPADVGERYARFALAIVEGV
jgi:TetR/AcrR family transcriptional regulator, cholesterol catabolism regulator